MSWSQRATARGSRLTLGRPRTLTPMKPRIFAIITVLASLSFSGCKPSEAENLYNSALRAEQQPLGDQSYATLEAYRKVVRADPHSSWGQRAQQRIDIIQSNINSRKAARDAQIHAMQGGADSRRAAREASRAAEDAAIEARRTRRALETKNSFTK